MTSGEAPRPPNSQKSRLSWTQATGNAGGTARYGALINSVTHVLMYSHYLWTSFGRKNPFKALLTKWQIAQHCAAS